jgi:hypothetical protein
MEKVDTQHCRSSHDGTRHAMTNSWNKGSVYRLGKLLAGNDGRVDSAACFDALGIVTVLDVT